MSTEPREAMRDMGTSAQGVGPVTGALLFCGSAFVVIALAWALWSSGVLS